MRTCRSRGSGRRFGYAQVMNPNYLYRKGEMSAFPEVLLTHWLKSLASNLKGARLSDPIDRWGRLAGNAEALCDVLPGQADPRRAEQF
ncbi:MAG: hypothetical protein NTV70_06395 [Acidobacteria bacterium]|nr:hypothetical protein [Acidobacteriota bacterium]